MREICRGEAAGVTRQMRREYIDRWIETGRLAGDPDAANDALPAADQGGPNILRKVVSFTRAAIRHAADGLRRTTESEYMDRISVCRTCDKFSGTDQKPGCSKCGCSLRVKLRWRTEACPLGKWGRLDALAPPARPIRLLWLSSDICQGGVPRYFKTLIDALPASIESTAIGFSSISESTTDFELIRQFRRRGVRIVCTDSAPDHLRAAHPEIEFRGPEVYDELIEGCDVVTTAVNNPHVLHRTDWRGKPIVAQMHSTCDETTRIGRLMAPHAACFTVTSEESRSNAVEKIGLPREKVRVVELAADLNRITTWRDPQDIRRELLAVGEHHLDVEFAMAAKWLVYCGRFSPEKRLPEIAAAVRELNRTAPWIGVFAGDGWAADKLKPQIRQTIGRRYLFAPWSDQVGDVLAAADVVICNSDYEGGPTSSIEALLAGVPIVSTDVGILQTAEGSYTSTGRQPTPERIARAVREASGHRAPMQRRPEDAARAKAFSGRFSVRRMAEDFAAAIAEARGVFHAK